ncbi:MAG: response regulator [Burkholderiaceae bacterium]
MDHILIVDDDIQLASLLREYLEAEGLQVSLAHDGEAGVKTALASQPDLLVMDVMMPGTDGITALRQLREKSAMPVLMLTAKGDDVDRIVGLELGADDYVPKPCTPRELLARVRAILRRHRAGAQAPDLQAEVSAGDLVMHPGRRTASFANQTLSLTGAEFGLLLVLARAAGAVVSKEELSKQGLGRELARYDRSIDVHISSIRNKLGKREDGESRVKAVRGQGYLLVSD